VEYLDVALELSFAIHEWKALGKCASAVRTFFLVATTFGDVIGRF
jgi:hypothetical protein